MSAQPFSLNPPANRSILQLVCAIGAALVGLVLFSYAIYFVPNQLAGSTDTITGFLIFLAIVGTLSIVGGVGYWMNKAWGLYIQLLSTFGQLLLPGSLFEFKLDLYHLTGWLCPLLSLAIVILAVRMRRKRTFS